MHKIHVFLEDWQYEALRTQAAREQRTISALIRELLTWHLAENQETARQRLAVIEGIRTPLDESTMPFCTARSDDADGTRFCRYQCLVCVCQPP
jgi:plasmid stability protein